MCVPIRWYQKWISPGLGRNCRFTPSCSQYAIEAIQTHGCIKGLLLAAARIARCNPLGRWGYDPVPEPGRWRNPARKLSPARLFSFLVVIIIPQFSNVICMDFSTISQIIRRNITLYLISVVKNGARSCKLFAPF